MLVLITGILGHNCRLCLLNITKFVAPFNPTPQDLITLNIYGGQDPGVLMKPKILCNVDLNGCSSPTHIRPL